MENLNMALVSSSSPKLVLGYSSLKNPTRQISRTKTSSFRLPFTLRNSNIAPRSPSAALSHSHENVVVIRKSGGDGFARIFPSSSQQTSSVGATPNLVPPPPPSSSQIGSPLFWIAVGVGFSALFSWVSRRVSQGVSSSVQNYAMQQALKTAMNQMNAQNNQFSNTAFSPPFPYATPPTSRPASPSPAASQPAVTVDVPATKVEAAPATDVKDETEAKKETNKYAFVDISPEETIQKSPFESFEDVTEASSAKDVQFPQEVSQNGAASKQGYGASETRNASSGLSVETLEKMMEDPTVQQMVFPHLPEEMRDPATFKWMMQNPKYRKQLEDMLNNMGGGNEFMMESLKNFDMNSPEVQQQFDQIGLTPQEVISKIMANPEVAVAFQSPRVQEAIMDCSTNPQNIVKYQNDREVMDVFYKLSELFPGVTGSP